MVIFFFNLAKKKINYWTKIMPWGQNCLKMQGVTRLHATSLEKIFLSHCFFFLVNQEIFIGLCFFLIDIAIWIDMIYICILSIWIHMILRVVFPQSIRVKQCFTSHMQFEGLAPYLLTSKLLENFTFYLWHLKEQFWLFQLSLIL